MEIANMMQDEVIRLMNAGDYEREDILSLNLRMPFSSSCSSLAA
jgi:hypothetical protein